MGGRGGLLLRAARRQGLVWTTQVPRREWAPHIGGNILNVDLTERGERARKISESLGSKNNGMR